MCISHFINHNQHLDTMCNIAPCVHHFFFFFFFFFGGGGGAGGASLICQSYQTVFPLPLAHNEGDIALCKHDCDKIWTYWP